MNLSEKLHRLNIKAKKYLELFAEFNIKEENDFHANKAAIMFMVHVVDDLATTAAQVPPHIYRWFLWYLVDTVEPLLDYQKTLVSKFGTYNTYKLYDFMIKDVPLIIEHTEAFKG